jgi:hypothetical protein
MVLKIHGAKGSTCTQRVLTALYEKNVPYELVTINFSMGEHKSEKHMKIQPFGKVPVLGFILFESRAIAKYIAAKYAGQGTPLLPAESDLKAYALFEQVWNSNQQRLKKSADPCRRRLAHLRNSTLTQRRLQLPLRRSSRGTSFFRVCHKLKMLTDVDRGDWEVPMRPSSPSMLLHLIPRWLSMKEFSRKRSISLDIR